MHTRFHRFSLFILGCLLLCAFTSMAWATLPACYHRRADIKPFLDSLVVADSVFHIVHVDSIGHSRGDQLGVQYPLYAVHITDNPTVMEDEPVVLIIGHIHAEEVIGLELTLKFMRDIVEHPWVYRDLFNNTHLVFVPTMNPDGLEVLSRGWDDTYRKNGYHPVEMADRPCNIRVGVGEDSCGVDLNRNFDFNWIYGDTLWVRADYEPFDYYKGPAPFSEPEAQAIRDLALAIHPTVSAVYHSSRAGGNAELGIAAWEWGPTNGPWRLSPDHQAIASFNRIYCDRLVKFNSGGQPYNPVFGKQRNGNLQEWFYSKLGCIQINTELGPPGNTAATIQPQQNILEPLLESDLRSIYWLCRQPMNMWINNEPHPLTPVKIVTRDAVTQQPIVAEWRNLTTWSPILGPWYTNAEFGAATMLMPQGQTLIMARREGYAADTVLIPVSPPSAGTTDVVTFDLQPLPMHTLELWLIDTNGNRLPGRVYLQGDYPRWIDVPNGQTALSVPEGDYQLIAVANAPERLILWRNIHVGGGHSEWFTLPSTEPGFIADFNGGMTGWTTGGTGDAWRATSDTSSAATGGTLTTESAVSLYGGGQYANNLNSWVQCDTPIPLGSGKGNTAMMTFWRRGRMDLPFDSLMVEVSTDGAAWQQVAGYTDLELPWTQSFVNLSAFMGQTIHLRFRFKSDSVLGDLGIHIDNVAIFTGTDTAVPDRPQSPVYSYKITGAYPNPFNPNTTITYDVAAPGSVTLVVFNTVGQEVRRFQSHAPAAGSYRLAWDGTTTAGAPVSSASTSCSCRRGRRSLRTS